MSDGPKCAMCRSKRSSLRAMKLRIRDDAGDPLIEPVCEPCALHWLAEANKSDAGKAILKTIYDAIPLRTGKGTDFPRLFTIITTAKTIGSFRRWSTLSSFSAKVFCFTEQCIFLTMQRLRISHFRDCRWMERRIRRRRSGRMG